MKQNYFILAFSIHTKLHYRDLVVFFGIWNESPEQVYKFFTPNCFDSQSIFIFISQTASTIIHKGAFYLANVAIEGSRDHHVEATLCVKKINC